MLMKLILITAIVAVVVAKSQLRLGQILGYGNSYNRVINLNGAVGEFSAAKYQPITSYAVASPQPIAFAATPKSMAIPRPVRYPVQVPLLVQQEHYPPQPFAYSFDSIDEYKTQMTRQESSDGSGTVKGSYSYRDANGMIRIVNYIADQNGFRAEIQTNEPGTKTSSPADAIIISSNPSIYKK